MLFHPPRQDGKMCILGLGEQSVTVSPMKYVFGRKTICGSIIGGTKDIKDMFEFAGKHNIKPQVEVVQLRLDEPEKINAALQKVDKSDVRYRLVLNYEN